MSEAHQWLKNLDSKNHMSFDWINKKISGVKQTTKNDRKKFKVLRWANVFDGCSSSVIGRVLQGDIVTGTGQTFVEVLFGNILKIQKVLLLKWF